MQAGTHTSKQVKNRGSVLQGKHPELLSWLEVTPWKCGEGRMHTSLSTEYHRAERCAGQEDLKTTALIRDCGYVCSQASASPGY